jgi:hypothetical protein
VVQAYNPRGLQLVTGSQPFQDTFLNVIFESLDYDNRCNGFANRPPRASSTLTRPECWGLSRSLMSGGEVMVDAEMQVILVFQ